MKLLKNKIFLPFLVSFLIFAVGYYLNNIYDCGYSVFCYYLFSQIAPSIFYPSFALTFVFFILLFIPHAVSAWWKFAGWYIVAAAITLLWPDDGGWNIGPTTEQTAQFLSAVYVAISLGIIAITLVNNWRKRKGEKPLGTFWYWFVTLILSFIALYVFGQPFIDLIVALATAP